MRKFNHKCVTNSLPIESAAKQNSKQLSTKSMEKEEAMCLHKYSRGYQLRYRPVDESNDIHNTESNTAKLSVTACKWLIGSLECTPKYTHTHNQ